MSKTYYVYIITDKPYGTLYTGVTNDIARRIYEHKNKLLAGFSARHNLMRLIYCEAFGDVNTAIHRETCIKRWKRRWKIELIEKSNPTWDELLTH
jgi:putative endonuclease